MAVFLYLRICMAVLFATSVTEMNKLKTITARGWYPQFVNLSLEGQRVKISFTLAPVELGIQKYIVYHGEQKNGHQNPQDIQSTVVAVNASGGAGQAELHSLRPGRTYTVMVAADVEDAVRKSVNFTFPVAVEPVTQDTCAPHPVSSPWIAGGVGLLSIILLVNTIFCTLNYCRRKRESVQEVVTEKEVQREADQMI